MKPCNFPERKNRRRKRALARLTPDTDAYRNTARLVTEDARDIRTKKYRGPAR